MNISITEKNWIGSISESVWYKMGVESADWLSYIEGLYYDDYNINEVDRIVWGTSKVFSIGINSSPSIRGFESIIRL
jgi:hypothetical protein